MSSRDLQALMLDRYIDQMQMHGAGSAAPQPADSFVDWIGQVSAESPRPAAMERGRGRMLAELASLREQDAARPSLLSTLMNVLERSPRRVIAPVAMALMVIAIGVGINGGTLPANREIDSRAPIADGRTAEPVDVLAAHQQVLDEVTAIVEQPLAVSFVELRSSLGSLARVAARAPEEDISTMAMADAGSRAMALMEAKASSLGSAMTVELASATNELAGIYAEVIESTARGAPSASVNVGSLAISLNGEALPSTARISAFAVSSSGNHWVEVTTSGDVRLPEGIYTRLQISTDESPEGWTFIRPMVVDHLAATSIALFVLPEEPPKVSGTNPVNALPDEATSVVVASPAPADDAPTNGAAKAKGKPTKDEDVTSTTDQPVVVVASPAPVDDAPTNGAAKAKGKPTKDEDVTATTDQPAVVVASPGPADDAPTNGAAKAKGKPTKDEDVAAPTDQPPVVVVASPALTGAGPTNGAAKAKGKPDKDEDVTVTTGQPPVVVVASPAPADDAPTNGAAKAKGKPTKDEDVTSTTDQPSVVVVASPAPADDAPTNGAAKAKGKPTKDEDVAPTTDQPAVVVASPAPVDDAPTNGAAKAKGKPTKDEDVTSTTDQPPVVVVASPAPVDDAPTNGAAKAKGKPTKGEDVTSTTDQPPVVVVASPGPVDDAPTNGSGKAKGKPTKGKGSI